MFWEFQQLEIHFPRASLQLGFSRVFNRSWATVFVPQIGNRSSGCWLAQFMCDTCAQATCEIERLSRCRPRKKRRCDRQRNSSFHSFGDSPRVPCQTRHQNTFGKHVPAGPDRPDTTTSSTNRFALHGTRKPDSTTLSTNMSRLHATQFQTAKQILTYVHPCCT